MPPIAPDALDRWMYRKNGMDYGPFSTHDLMEMIRRKELLPETEVYNRRTRKWQRVDLVPRFAEFLQAEAEEKKQQEMMREVVALERTIVIGRKVPVVLFVVIGLVVAAVGWIFLRPPAEARAGYPANFYRDLSFPRLALYKASDIVARPTEAAKPAAPKAVRRTVRPRAGGGGVATVDGDTGIEVDLSFEDDGSAGGRTLGREDLEGVQRRASPGLIRCFRQEAGARPDFRGGTVSLYIMNRGDVQVSRVQTNPPPTAELVACSRAAVSGLKVPAFTGPIQVMEIPLHIAESR